MKYHLPLTIAILATQLLAGQAATNTVLTGKVVDGETGQGIPYASIYCNRCDYGGTITDEMGDYVVAARDTAVEIRVDHLMYGTASFTVGQMPAILELRVSPYDLPEVVVDGTEAIALVQQLYENSTALGGNFFRGEGFYRQTTRLDTVYTELLEYFVKVKYSNRGIADWKVVTGRYAVKPVTGSLAMDNQSYMTRGWKVYSAELNLKNYVAPVNPDAFPLYTYRIVDRLVKNGAEVVVIDCQPTEEAPDDAIAARLYIEKNTARLLRGDYRIGELGLNQPTIGAITNSALTATINFRLSEGGITLMESMTTTTTLTYTTANSGAKPVSVTSVYLNFPPEQLRGTSDAVASLDLSDLKAARSKKYRPKWWRNHPVIAPTPAERTVIESFERDGVFGNYFSR